jgi:hypothetical protein
MRDLDDLRYALAAETRDLYLDLPADGIRRRARRVRTRRIALRAGVVALVLTLAVPVAVLARGPAGTEDPARPAPSCSRSAGSGPWLGEPADTGLTATLPDGGVFVGLAGTRDRPTLVVELRDRTTGVVVLREEFTVGRDLSADILIAGGNQTKIINIELALAPDKLLYVGLYARPATEIRMVVGGRSSAAGTAYNEDTLWTIFWAYRNLPPPREDDADAPGTRPTESVRFEVYMNGELRVDVPAMADVHTALDRRTTGPTCAP